MKKLYVGIDLHSNNSYIAIINEDEKVLYSKKHNNTLKEIAAVLKPYKKRIQGVVVESTFNWYWLVDGLEELGFKVHLANPAGNIQYGGLKHRDDKYDAFWLAQLLKLGILKEGYIYPPEIRAVRDLSRKRGQLVQMRTSNILSLQNIYIRNTGIQLSGTMIKRMQLRDIEQMKLFPEQKLSIKFNLELIHQLNQQIKEVESVILNQIKLTPEFIRLRTIDGIGPILALTIMLETGDISRFKKVGNFASYCRCVSSLWTSNNKKKGKGNSKNGNRYLAWAFVEAAAHCKVSNPAAKAYYLRKKKKTKAVVAFKAIAHKLSRAAYYVMRDGAEFDSDKLFCH